MAGCSLVTGLGDELIQLVIVVPGGDPLQVEERDTVQVVGFGLTKSGDSVAPEIVWEKLDAADTVISLEAMTGRVAGEAAGSTSVQGRSGSLISDPISVRVLTRSDTVQAVSGTVATVAPGESVSSPLTVSVLAFAVGDTTGLANRPVRFAFIEPQTPTVDFTGHVDSVAVTVPSDADGLASVTISRRDMMAAPDSVVVEARGKRTTTGGEVSGSPIRFVVFFE